MIEAETIIPTQWMNGTHAQLFNILRSHYIQVLYISYITMTAQTGWASLDYATLENTVKSMIASIRCQKNILLRKDACYNEHPNMF